MKILTGNELKEYVDHHVKTIPDKRFYFDKVNEYLHSHTFVDANRFRPVSIEEIIGFLS